MEFKKKTAKCPILYNGKALFHVNIRMGIGYIGYALQRSRSPYPLRMRAFYNLKFEYFNTI